MGTGALFWDFKLGDGRFFEDLLVIIEIERQGES